MLIVLASFLIPISVISTWAITTVTKTDKYVATMAPLARNPVIVDHLATKATDVLFSSHIVQDKVTAALPAKANSIVKPVEAQVRTYVHGLALRFFESEQFGKLWDGLNRHTHSAVVDILTGKQSALTKRVEQGGAIVLNLTPALDQIIDKANARGVTLFNPLKPLLEKSNSGLGLTVVSKDQVATYSGGFNLLVKLGWAVPVTALVLGLLSIAIAVRRRKTLRRLSIGVALFTTVLLAVLSLGRNVFLHQATVHNLDADLSAAVWDTLLRFLKADLRWMLLAALIVACFARVFGPARYAIWIRCHVAVAAHWVADQVRMLSGNAGQAAAESERARRVGGWIVEHLTGLRIVRVIGAGLFLVFLGSLTGWTLLVILIVLAVYLALLQLVAAWGPEGVGAVEPPDFDLRPKRPPYRTLDPVVSFGPAGRPPTQRQWRRLPGPRTGPMRSASRGKG